METGEGRVLIAGGLEGEEGKEGVIEEERIGEK